MTAAQNLEELHKVLFVCSLNRFRSYTAEKVYEGFSRYQVRSRGTEQGARIRIRKGDIGWADIIFVMEKRHAERLRQKYPEDLRGKRLVTLFIPDIYEPMERFLIAKLCAKLEPYLEFPPQWRAVAARARQDLLEAGEDPDAGDEAALEDEPPA